MLRVGTSEKEIEEQLVMELHVEHGDENCMYVSVVYYVKPCL